MTCKDACRHLQGKRPMVRYLAGCKYCAQCGCYHETTELLCFCCHGKLRVTAKCKHTRQLVQEMKDVRRY